MGLVSLDLYRVKADADWPLLVVPRVITRTTEIVRAIVRIEGGEGLPKPPVVTVPTGGTPTSPSREAFLEAIRGKPDAGAPENLESLLTELEKLGLEVAPLPAVQRSPSRTPREAMLTSGSCGSLMRDE